MRQDDVIEVLRFDPESWWTLWEIAKAAGVPEKDFRTQRSHAGRILDSLGRFGLVEVRTVPTPYKGGSPTIRQWRWVG